MSRTHGSGLQFLAVVILGAALVPGVLPAFPVYDDGNGNGCVQCHDYTGGNPSLHDRHRDQAMDTSEPLRCKLCHGAQDRPPVATFRSQGGLPGTSRSDLSCTGCHGNEPFMPSVTMPGFQKATGYGLRLHHRNAGITLCATCHSAGGPVGADGPPPPETDPPPYFALPAVLVKDPCNKDGSESVWKAMGLDNDGDGLYDQNDPDCSVASGCDLNKAVVMGAVPPSTYSNNCSPPESPRLPGPPHESGVGKDTDLRDGWATGPNGELVLYQFDCPCADTMYLSKNQLSGKIHIVH